MSAPLPVLPDTIEEMVIDFLLPNLFNVEGVEFVIPAQISMTDPSGSAGVIMSDWNGIEWEMFNGVLEPTISRYLFQVQHCVMAADRIKGPRLHRQIAKAIRLMLYTDEDFLVGLRQLAETSGGRSERVTKLSISGQKFDAAEISSGTFVSMSVTDFFIETHTTHS